MSNNVVPEKLINFRAYNDGNDLLGVTDVQLPSLDAMTETVKGAGTVSYTHLTLPTIYSV